MAGSTLCFHVFTAVPPGDVDTANNEYDLCLPVVNSFDPNSKEVSPKGEGLTGNIPFTTDELTYTVHFQNTGTAPALSVSIIDTLDSGLNAASLVILGSSHNVMPEWLAPGVVKFNFNNINLPDSNANLAASNGFISFRVKLRPPHPAGTVIENRAFIYFDTNPAVVTNSVISTLVVPSGLNEVHANNFGAVIYPNPVTDQLTIEIASLTDNCLLTILNVSGQELMRRNIIENKIQIDLNRLSSGVYFLKFISGNAVEVRKIVKE